jgi:DNA-binding response OmpR family regulator
VRKLILLADDSATVQQLVKLAFADEAIEVLSAPSVSAARECLNQRTPDLILVDPLLPDGDALALLRAIRSTSETSRIPVVMLMPASVRPERTIGASVDAVLAKPLNRSICS